MDVLISSFTLALVLSCDITRSFVYLSGFRLAQACIKREVYVETLVLSGGGPLQGVINVYHMALYLSKVLTYLRIIACYVHSKPPVRTYPHVRRLASRGCYGRGDALPGECYMAPAVLFSLMYPCHQQAQQQTSRSIGVSLSLDRLFLLSFSGLAMISWCKARKLD